MIPLALAEIKAYMKIDGTDEDALIAQLAQAAADYLAAAGVHPPPADAPDGRYPLVLCALTLYYYEFRTTAGTLPPALRRILNQMKAEGGLTDGPTA